MLTSQISLIRNKIPTSTLTHGVKNVLGVPTLHILWYFDKNHPLHQQEHYGYRQNEVLLQCISFNSYHLFQNIRWQMWQLQSTFRNPKLLTYDNSFMNSKIVNHPIYVIPHMPPIYYSSWINSLAEKLSILIQNIVVMWIRGIYKLFHNVSTENITFVVVLTVNSPADI